MNLDIYLEMTTQMVRNDGPDLSARQMGVFLNAYLTEGPHTVRGLAETLNVSKPAISRALDRLGELDFLRRKVDPDDRRSVMTQRTDKGAEYLRVIEAMAKGAEIRQREAAKKAA